MMKFIDPFTGKEKEAVSMKPVSQNDILYMEVVIKGNNHTYKAAYPLDEFTKAQER